MQTTNTRECSVSRLNDGRKLLVASQGFNFMPVLSFLIYCHVLLFYVVIVDNECVYNN
jgi:hypothetical protein